MYRWTEGKQGDVGIGTDPDWWSPEASAVGDVHGRASDLDQSGHHWLLEPDQVVEGEHLAAVGVAGQL